MTQQLITLAKSAMIAEEFDKAIQHLEEALSQDHEDKAVIDLLVEARQKRREKLTAHVKSLISKSQAEMAEKNYETVISLLESVMTLAKDEPDVANLTKEEAVEVLLNQAQHEKHTEHSLYMARTAFERGDYDNARNILYSIETRRNPEVEKLLRQVEDAFGLWNSATRAMDNKRYAIASEYLQELKQRFPYSRRQVDEMKRQADYFYSIELAERARQQGQLDEAHDYFKQAIRSNPQGSEAWNGLNEIEAALQRRQRAQQLVMQAESDVSAGNFDRAVQLFQEALEYDSDFRAAHNGLREATDLRAQQNEAEIEKLLVAGQNALELLDLDIARRRIEEALNINPRHRKALQLLKETDELQHRQEQLEPRIQELITLGQEAIGIQNYNDARRRLNEAMSINPNHRQVKRLFLELGDEERREAEIQRLLTESHSAITLKEFAHARQILEQASRIKPEHRQVEDLLLRVQILEQEDEIQKRTLLQAERAIKAGKFTEAERLYERILELNPDNTNAVNGLQEVDRLLKNVEAERLADSASEYVRTGNEEEALQQLKRAEQLASSPDLKERVSTLVNNANLLIAKKAELKRQVEEAKILLSLNQPDKALEITKELLQADPTNQIILDVYKQAFEEVAKQPPKVTDPVIQERPSVTQYLLAAVFIIVFILSLLRLLGVW